MDKHYPITCYDNNFSLKVSGTMWLIFLFLMAPFVVTLLSIANRSDPMQLINMFYPDRLTLSLGAFASIPTAMLMYAWAKRAPGAPLLVKYVWQKGRIILIMSVALNVAVIFSSLVLGAAHTFSASSWAQLAINMLVAFVVVTSRYIRDCFADFPDVKK